jgi:hypothetical protein
MREFEFILRDRSGKGAASSRFAGRSECASKKLGASPKRDFTLRRPAFLPRQRK